MTRVEYSEKVLSRITDPGFVLIVAGAAVTYASGLITRGIADAAKREKASLFVKAAGCIVAFAGAVLLFT